MGWLVACWLILHDFCLLIVNFSRKISFWNTIRQFCFQIRPWRLSGLLGSNCLQMITADDQTRPKKEKSWGEVSFCPDTYRLIRQLVAASSRTLVLGKRICLMTDDSSISLKLVKTEQKLFEKLPLQDSNWDPFFPNIRVNVAEEISWK